MKNNKRIISVKPTTIKRRPAYDSSGKGKKELYDKQFTMTMLQFLKGDFMDTIESMKALIRINKEYPAVFHKLTDTRITYDVIEDIIEPIPNEEKDMVSLVFFKASLLNSQFKRILNDETELSDLEGLYTNFERFSAFVDNKIKKLETISLDDLDEYTQENK